MSDDDRRQDAGGTSDDSSGTTDERNEDALDFAEARPGPLAADEFREVLQRFDALGLTWTAERVPRMKPKEKRNREAFFSEELGEIQQKYPTFPRELAAVVLHALTGSQPPETLAGSVEDLPEKVAAVREFIVTTDYRAEFFFNYAVKVPHFLNVDWEVVIKAFEKNVDRVPGISYALLSLHFQDPERPNAEEGEEHTKTVAVDERLIDSIIETLNDVKSALGQTRTIAEAMDQRPEPED